MSGSLPVLARVVPLPVVATQGGDAPSGLAASIEKQLRVYFAAHEHGLPTSGLYERILHEVERPLLRMALEACGGNQLRAAELLGLNRNTLRKKLRELGLEAGRARAASRREAS